MKILVLSDLHLEFHRDGGRALVSDIIDGAEVDACVLAGDIAVGSGIPAALALFCERYPIVFYVHGNHEFYGCTKDSVDDFTNDATHELKNLRWLDCCYASANNGQVFAGAPLWFPEWRNGPKHALNDFVQIRGFEDWVYDENSDAVKFLDGIRHSDIVVTHHLPSMRSVPEKYKDSALNPFFVTELDKLIARRRPKLWVHGHTHGSCDYMHGDTRVVCNPYGYAGVDTNPEFDPGKVVEV